MDEYFALNLLQPSINFQRSNPMKDIYTLRLGSETKEQRNPFAGEALQVPIDLGFDQNEKSLLDEYFSGLGGKLPDEDGFRQVNTEDGFLIRFRDYGLLTEPSNLTAIAFEYDTLTESVAKVLFGVFSICDCVIRESDENVIHKQESLSAMALNRWEKIDKINTVEELFSCLAKTD